jgi:hypothetical protein
MNARRLVAVLGAVTLLALTAVSAFAWPGDVEGPPPFVLNDLENYYLWHDARGLHLKTFGQGDAHHFVARLTTDGQITNVSPTQMEAGDTVTVSPGGHLLVYDVYTYGEIDVVHFKISGGTFLHLDLQVNNTLVPTNNIYLGSGWVNPPTNPFTIYR